MTQPECYFSNCDAEFSSAAKGSLPPGLFKPTPQSPTNDWHYFWQYRYQSCSCPNQLDKPARRTTTILLCRTYGMLKFRIAVTIASGLSQASTVPRYPSPTMCTDHLSIGRAVTWHPNNRTCQTVVPRPPRAPQDVRGAPMRGRWCGEEGGRDRGMRWPASPIASRVNVCASTCYRFRLCPAETHESRLTLRSGSACSFAIPHGGRFNG
jgi:hypothetical protein